NLRVTDPAGLPLWEGWPDLPGAPEPWSDPSAPVVATWRHIPWGLPTVIHELFSNGRIDSPTSDNTWSRTGNTLTLRWKDAQAPGGFWVDTCQVSADGRTYTGKNQMNRPVRGERFDRAVR